MQNAINHTDFSLFANPRTTALAEQGRNNMDNQATDQWDSGQRLVDFLRLTRDCVWEADSALRLTFASRRTFDVIGHHPEDLLGKPLTNIGAFVDKQGNPKPVSMNGNFRDACFLACDSQGQLRQLSLSAIAIFDPDTGAFQGIRGVARPLADTTESNSHDI